MATKAEAREAIAKLVKKYTLMPIKEIKATNESNTKQAFIEPLFRALGWDVDDTHEVSLEEAASNGRVDYAFKINDVSRFYLEAKPFKAELNNLIFIKQAITYAYSKGVTWAVLTNFENIRVFNAQAKDDQGFINLHCKAFEKDFDDLWLLSKEGVLDKLLEEKAQKYGKLPPLIPIEERLFKQLREWREHMFNSLALNDWLKREQRDEVIEKLFNRLIFIRTAEDRNLEGHRLRAAVNQWQSSGKKKEELAKELRGIFAYYNGYYDSDLFKPHLLDDEKLYFDQQIVADILNGLYEIPGGIADYDFSIIDADVLGRVYEQYLGFVSRIESDKDYTFVEKKAHRKEQGIYYTPKFVTDYIVRETVGRFITENAADGGDKILNMKILDPACGSGSFLIRAFDELLNYHAKVRGKSPNELSHDERMPYLTGNIFGVDLDERAVEFACLNLLLRGLAKRDFLPPLTDNIKQGNSLISGTEPKLKTYFGNDWKAKHPFNWCEEFKDIMNGGGFDVVIGNPPYVGILEMSKFESEDTKDFYKKEYQSATGNYDIYVLFLEKAIQLAKENGLISFIVPNKFLVNDYGVGIRDILLRNKILQLLDLSNLRIFKEAAVYPIVLLVKKGAPTDDHKVKIGKADNEGKIWYSEVDQKGWGDSRGKVISIGASESIAKLLSKIESKSIRLMEIADVVSGTTGFDYSKYGKLIHGTNGKGLIKFVVTHNIEPYQVIWDTKIHYFKKTFNGAYFDVGNETVSVGRRQLYKTKNKILIRGMSKKLVAGLDEQGFALGVGVYSALIKKFDVRFILALLNSTLINFYYKAKFESKHLAGGYISFNAGQLQQIPVCKIDPSRQKEQPAYGELISLVDTIFEIETKLAPIRNQDSNESESLIKERDKTKKEIDDIVYGLYGLTKEDIKIVEAGK